MSLAVEDTHPECIPTIRVELDGLTSKKLVAYIFSTRRPLLDVHVGTVEVWSLVPITLLDLDDVNALDGALAEDFIKHGLHLLPSDVSEDAGDVDLRSRVVRVRDGRHDS